MIPIHNNSIGSVAKCDCCNKFTLRLGTVIMPVNTKQMNELIFAFSETLASCCDKNKRINFALNEAHLSLSLLKAEIKQAIKLLEMSLLMIQVKKLITNSYN